MLKYILALALLIPFSAQAQNLDFENGQFYVGGSASAVHTLDTDTRGFATLPGGARITGTASFGHEVGGGASVMAGYDLGSLRLEAEGFATHNRLENVAVRNLALGAGPSFGGVPVFDARGRVLFYGGMLGAYFDYENDSAFTPYIGASFGWGWAAVSGLEVAGISIRGSDKDDVPVGQIRAGFEVALNETTSLTIGAGYRQTLQDPRLKIAGGTVDLGLKQLFGGIGFRVKL